MLPISSSTVAGCCMSPALMWRVTCRPPPPPPRHRYCVFSIVCCVMQQVYTRLSERLGVTDHLTVLNIMLQKIVVNLKAFASCEDVISHTLALFQARCASLPRNTKRRMSSPASPCI